MRGGRWRCEGGGVRVEVHLLTAGVEGVLQGLASVGVPALLHGGEVVWVLERDLQPVSLHLQGAQEVLWETACTTQLTEQHNSH